MPENPFLTSREEAAAQDLAGRGAQPGAPTTRFRLGHLKPARRVAQNDSGLACHLLGIVDAEQLRHHPLRGAIFESWVVSEIYKARVHNALEPRIHHYREARGTEVDLLVEGTRGLLVVEAKSAATVAQDFFTGIRGLRAKLDLARESRAIEARVVFGGDESQQRSEALVMPWSAIAELPWD